MQSSPSIWSRTMQRLAIQPYQWFLFTFSLLLYFTLQDSNQFIFLRPCSNSNPRQLKTKMHTATLQVSEPMHVCNLALHLSLSLSPSLSLSLSLSLNLCNTCNPVQSESSLNLCNTCNPVQSEMSIHSESLTNFVSKIQTLSTSYNSPLSNFSCFILLTHRAAHSLHYQRLSHLVVHKVLHCGCEQKWTLLL